jgi:hypothetical protein
MHGSSLKKLIAISVYNGGVVCRHGVHGVTVKGTLLESVPPGVTTLTVPVVAPVGTVVVISDLDLTVNVADVPLKVTLVEPVRLVPRILTAAPTLPEVVRFNKWAQAFRQAEERATAISIFTRIDSAFIGCPVENAVSVLNQRCVGVLAIVALGYGAKGVKCGQRAAGGDLEDCAMLGGPAIFRYPIEVPIGGLDERRILVVGAFLLIEAE